MKRFLKALGFIFLILILYLATQTFVTFAFGFGFGIKTVLEVFSSGGITDPGGLIEEISGYMASYLPMIEIIAIVITAVFYLLIYTKRTNDLKAFCQLKALRPMTVAMLIILGLSISELIGFALTLLSETEYFSRFFEQYDTLTDYIFSGSFIYSLLITGIAVPIFEELLFRGLVFGELKKVSHIWVALILQAVIFGVIHLNVIQGSYAMIIGLLLGFVYYRSGSLLAPILLHMTFNSSSVIIDEFVSAETLEKWNLHILIISVALFAASAIILLKSKDFDTVSHSLSTT